MMRFAAALVALSMSACVLHHSKQALWSDLHTVPSADATFETEEDSGVSIFGIIQIAEPDHYAVLLERLRRRYQCMHMHHAQLDFYTDHWLLIAFPISRVTLICERGADAAVSGAAAAEPPAAQPDTDEYAPSNEATDDEEAL